MENQLYKALKNNNLLKNVDISKLNLSEIKGKLFSVNEGEILYREGEKSNTIYIVLSGEINLLRKKVLGKTKSMIFRDNEFFGNEEFFEETARTSTAVALRDSYLIAISREEIETLITQEQSIFENLVENIPEREAEDSQPAEEPEEFNSFESMEEEVSLEDIEEKEVEPKDESGADEFSEEDKKDEFAEEKKESGLSLDEFEDIAFEEPGEEKRSKEEETKPEDEKIDLEEDEAFLASLSLEDKKSTSEQIPEEKPAEEKKEIKNKPEEKSLDKESPEMKNEPEKEEEQLPPKPATPIAKSAKQDKKETGDKKETAKPKLSQIFSKKNDKTANLNNEQLAKIIQAAQTVNSNIKLDDVLQNIVNVATELTDADRGTLYIVEKDKSELWSKVAMGDETREYRLKMGEGIAGFVAKSGEIVNIEDVQSDPRFKSDFDKASGYETINMLCFPISNKEDEIIGVLQLLNSANGKFSEIDEGFLSALSIHAALALENAELVEKLLKAERVSSLGKMANFLIQDIKKPILVSKRYAEHMKSKELPEDAVQVVDMLLEQITQVADLVQSTSSYADGKTILRTVNTSLNKTLDDFVERLESFVESNQCELLKDFDKDVKVKIDSKEFFQGFQHIIKNACEAMPEGGNIYLTTKQTGNEVKISFKDSGLGISDLVKDKIFEPFMSHGKKEGTGLGLTITKNIVEAHDGKIDVESMLGSGTTVTISLPVSSAL